MIDSQAQAELEALQTGPLALLTQAVKNKTTLLISCRNNKKLTGRVKAFDRHFNMILEEVDELWMEYPKKGKGVGQKGEPILRDRYVFICFRCFLFLFVSATLILRNSLHLSSSHSHIPKMFLRGDNVIIVVREPKLKPSTSAKSRLPYTE
jgi:small nuclear ribonucleoprotein D2